MATTLTLDEMAASAFRAWSFAGQVEEDPQWDRLSPDEQQRWVRLARQAEPLFLSMEDRRYGEVAAAIAGLWLDRQDQTFFNSLSRRMQLIWQAVTRHLMAVIDTDDNEGPGQLERSWGEWVESKLKGEP